MSYPAGRFFSATPRSRRLLNPGARRATSQSSEPNNAMTERAIQWEALRGRTFRIPLNTGCTLGNENKYDGVRCSIVTCAAFSVSDGIMLTAVAPLPITTSRLPV